MQQNDAGFLDLRRTAQEYPVSRRKIQQLIKANRLRAYKFDGKILVRRQDIEQVLTAQPIGGEVTA